MKFVRISIILVCAVASGDLPMVAAAPARFWLSSSSVDPTGLEAPQIAGVENAKRYFYLWGQPATVDSDQPYDVATNRFKTIQNFSVNLVTDFVEDPSDPILDFLDGTFTVFNPMLDGKHRFQFVFDSHTTTGGLTSTGGALDEVNGLQGFSIVSTSANGIGHSANHPTLGCHANDPFCAPTHDAQQSPAWLIGSVAVKAVAPAGDSYLHLQIGQNGMSYKGEATQIPALTFGLGSGPIYDARLSGDRQMTKTMDDPDAALNAVAAAQLSTWNGTTGNWTDSSWAGGVPQSFATNAMLPVGLGSHVITVTGKQLANETTVDGGRLHIANNSSLASSVVVGPSGSISGQGWVGSDLSLQTGATLTVDSFQPLLVVGSANVSGAAIRLGSNFTGSGSNPIEILRTFGGVQGTFAPAVGQNLGGGLFVGAINTIGDSVFLQMSGVAGDFNGNNVVDAADYIVWRNSLGCSTTACISADGNHNGTIDQSDYAVWRAHFGQTASGSSAFANVAAVIPEPTVLVMLLTGLIATFFRQWSAARTPRHRCWHAPVAVQSFI
ncbi:MAG: PEP-CTERM sorting domain-containing protein [Pirellulales bacterium]